MISPLYPLFVPKNLVSRDKVRPSSPASACSFSMLRLNLMLTHGIPPAFRDGVHVHRQPTSGQPEFIGSRSCAPLTSTAESRRHRASRPQRSSRLMRLFFSTPTSLMVHSVVVDSGVYCSLREGFIFHGEPFMATGRVDDVCGTTTCVHFRPYESYESHQKLAESVTSTVMRENKVPFAVVLAEVIFSQLFEASTAAVALVMYSTTESMLGDVFS